MKIQFALAALFLAVAPLAATTTETAWRTVDLAARPMNIAENRGTLWVCGADELVANSGDGGKTWSVNHVTRGGGVLLNIGFANEKFGYAAGTGGAFIVTKDGGVTWERIKAPAQVIYAASFSDQNHGLIQTPRTILTTADGGETWEPVKADFTSSDLKGFSHVLELVALDPEHMSMVLSRGNASYFEQKHLITRDGGKTWHAINIPSTSLTKLIAHGGEYWFAGMEVIEKDKPGGGYGVPLVMHSPDGENWTHLPRWSRNEFSTCGGQGCLYWDGAGVQIPPVNPVSYWKFAAEKAVTAKWAAASGSICSVAIDLKCAEMKITSEMPERRENSSPIASLLAPPPLDAPQAQGPQCIFCDIEKVMVTNDFQGVADVELKLQIAANGLVSQVEVLSSTKSEIGERVAATVRNWIFVPYEKDGVVHPVVTKVKLRTQAIKSK
jgi:hypothetical protein